jgi:hypothetical protein
MSGMPVFPVGCYWERKRDSSSPLAEATYSVLWLFSSRRFRYIFCWPGYTWMTASGTWHSANGKIYCRGTSSSFTDDFTDNHANRPYTAMFTHTGDGQSIVSVGPSPHVLTRLNPNQPGTEFRLEEQTVPTHWTTFSSLIWQIEKQMGIAREGLVSFLRDSSAPY